MNAENNGSRRKAANLVVDSRALLRLSIPFLVLLISNIAILLIVSFQSWKFLENLNIKNSELVSAAYQFTNQIINSMLIGGFIFGALSIALWMIFSHRIFGPVVPLCRHIQKLSQGDYSEKVVLRKNDELKSIADGLNQLTETLKNSRGQSLVQILISMAVMGILTLVMVTIQSNQANENRSLTEKLAGLDLQRLVSATLADGSVCTYEINQLSSGARVFNANSVTDTSSPPDIDLGQSIPASASPGAPAIVTVQAPASPLSTSLIVTKISISGIKCPSPCTNPSTSNSFTANVRIDFDNKKLFRPLHPVESMITLTTSDLGGGLKQIISCKTASGDQYTPGQPCTSSRFPNNRGVTMYGNLWTGTNTGGVDGSKIYCCGMGSWNGVMGPSRDNGWNGAPYGAGLIGCDQIANTP